MFNDLISVIVPAFNVANYIEKCVASLVNQTYKNIEIVVVDDCSTDDTDKIVSEFVDSRIKYFKNERNSGAAVSRNKAIKEAQGVYYTTLIVRPLKLNPSVNDRRTSW